MIPPSIESEIASSASAVWDAGDLGCGELVLELRGRLLEMPGRLLRVIAFDPGAPEDIPSWCRMTGHELVRRDERTKSYWIRARGTDASAPFAASVGDVMDHIYSPRLFALANALPPASRLAVPDVTASAKSKMCGSTAEVDVSISDGAIEAYAQRVKACLLGRATASVVAREIIGTPLTELRQVAAEMRAMLEAQGAAPVGRWADLGVLAPVHEIKARHASALLVFTALERAIEDLPAGR